MPCHATTSLFLTCVHQTTVIKHSEKCPQLLINHALTYDNSRTKTDHLRKYCGVTTSCCELIDTGCPWCVPNLHPQGAYDRALVVNPEALTQAEIDSLRADNLPQLQQQMNLTRQEAEVVQTLAAMLQSAAGPQ